MLHCDPEFFRYVMFSDETTFHNNGQLNRLSLLVRGKFTLIPHNWSTLLKCYCIVWNS